MFAKIACRNILDYSSNLDELLPQRPQGLWYPRGRISPIKVSRIAEGPEPQNKWILRGLQQDTPKTLTVSMAPTIVKGITPWPPQNSFRAKGKPPLGTLRSKGPKTYATFSTPSVYYQPWLDQVRIFFIVIIADQHHLDDFVVITSLVIVMWRLWVS